MQINYPNEDWRRATAQFWYVPDIQNSIQDMMVPPVYAPYGTIGFWPNAVATKPLMFSGSASGVLNTAANNATSGIAPNSGAGTTVASSAVASGLADAPPAASVQSAQFTGNPIGPTSLVAPLPSITQSPSAPPVPVMSCNSTDAWVAQNPMIAALGILGVYVLLRGRK
jgi:hypothetical protein